MKIKQIQNAFRENGFDVGFTDNEFLQERFGTNELYEAVISREKFLSLHLKRNEGENMNDDMIYTDEDIGRQVADTNSELNEMFLDGENNSKSKEISEGLGEKSDAKVLVKTNNQSTEGGYGSVFGVVLVIISISFILAALFIQMLS